MMCDIALWEDERFPYVFDGVVNMIINETIVYVILGFFVENRNKL